MASKHPRDEFNLEKPRPRKGRGVNGGLSETGKNKGTESRVGGSPVFVSDDVINFPPEATRLKRGTLTREELKAAGQLLEEDIVFPEDFTSGDQAIVDDGGVTAEQIDDEVQRLTTGLETADEIIGSRVQEVRLGEKSETYWESTLRVETLEAREERREQLERERPMVPDFILENLRKVEDGRTRFWRAEGTIVAFDLSGFTKMTEAAMANEDWTQGTGSGSQKVNETISQLFGEIHDEARRAGGELISLGGDEVLYMFLGDQHQQRGLHFANRGRGRITERNDDKISLSGGVASGSLLLGAVRLDEKRSLPMVLGEPVKEARRLEGVASRGEVMVHSAMTSMLKSKDAAIQQELGVTLGKNFDDLEAVGEYLKSTEHKTDNLRPTYDTVTAVARFLHPHQRYMAENEGIPPELFAGERRPMTVMFVDMDIEGLHHRMLHEVKGTTTADNSEALREFEDLIQKVNGTVRNYRGNFEKVVLGSGYGSKLMMLFAKGQKEANALQCAKEVVEILEKKQIEASAGIYSGMGYRGMTGALEAEQPKGELGIISTVANRAARLSKGAGRGNVLADKLTVMQAEDEVSVEVEQTLSQKAMGLKGVDQEGTVFRIGKVEDKSALIEQTDGVQLVGRETQQQQMRDMFDQVVLSGKQGVELMVGERGEGKSLLTSELIREHLKQHDAEIIKGKAREIGQEDIYGLWKIPARRIFGIKESDSPMNVLEKVRAKLGEVGIEYIQYAGLFVDEFELAKLNVIDDQRFAGFSAKAAEVFSYLMAEQAKTKPVIMVMEDLQWADQSSQELLKSVLAGTKDARVLFHLVGRSRAGLMDELQLDKERTTQIELGPIAEADWSDFIAAQFPIDGMREYAELRRRGEESWRREEGVRYRLMRANERLSEMTYRLSGGNPQVGRLIIRYLINYQDIHAERLHSNPNEPARPIQFFEEKDGVYRFKDYIHTDLLPDVKRLDATYERMLSAVKSPEERMALKFAAKLREIRDTELAEVLSIDVKTAAKFLERWEQRGWLDRRGEAYFFAHANAQETIERDIGEVMLVGANGKKELLTNEVLSRKVGEYKEARGGSVEDLARLFGASDDALKGIHYNILMGNTAYARQDMASYRIAVNAYNRAITIFEDDYVEGLSKHNGSTGKRWEELPAAVKTHLVVDALEAYSKLAKVSAMVGVSERKKIEVVVQAIDVALERLNKFGEALPSDDDRWMARAELEILKANRLHAANHTSEAAEIVTRYAVDDNKMTENVRMDEAGQIVGDARHRVLAANFYNTVGDLTYRGEGSLKVMSDEREAIEYYDLALRFVGPEGGADESLIRETAMRNKIVCLQRQKEWGQVDELTNELLKWEDAKGFRAGLVATKIAQAEGLISRGAMPELKTIREELYGVLRSVRDHAPNKETSLYRVLINLSETIHDYDDAKRVVKDFLPVLGGKLGEVSHSQKINRFKVELAWLLAKAGDDKEAEDVVKEIEVAGDEAVGQETKGMLPMVNGMLAVRRKEYTVAETELNNGLEILKAIDGNVNVGLVLVELAELEHSRGNEDARKLWLQQALLSYGDDEPIERRFIKESLNKKS